MIYDIFGFNLEIDLNLVLKLFLIFLLSLLLWAAFYIFTKVMFLKSSYILYMFIFLPLVIHIITSAISTNIALSLGMVGALSIVRFRTPIKNPMELLIYFLLIASGIVSNTNFNLYINFIFITIFLLMITSLIEIFLSKYKIFKLLDIDEDSIFLKIITKENIDYVNSTIPIFSSSFDGEKYYFRFKSTDEVLLKSIIDSVNKSNLISYSIEKSI